MKDFRVALIVTAFAVLSLSTRAQNCNLNATTSTFSSELASATAGQTVCLATGNYGAFAGVSKSSPGVTIAAAQGATPTLSLEIHQTSPVAQWLIFQGLTISGGDLSGPANHLTFQNDTFTDKLNIWADSDNNACSNCTAMTNSAIVFNNDVFNMSANQSGTGGYEARVNINGGSSTAGVTIENSQFTTGCADGIDINGGGDGVTIGPGNVFYNLQQGSCGPHIDPIQFDGSSIPGPVITGNYFYNNSTGITAYDNLNDGMINNNVITNTSQDSMLIAGFDSSSVVEHNTVIGDVIICGYTHEGNPCDAIIRNNITDGFDPGGTTISGSSGTAPSFFDYNLCTTGSCQMSDAVPSAIAAGSHSLSGTPTYTGGSSPSTYAGFALTSSSLGHNAGSDGKDIGINTTGTTSGPPQPSADIVATVY